jgi:hypothetical protein
MVWLVASLLVFSSPSLLFSTIDATAASTDTRIHYGRHLVGEVSAVYDLIGRVLGDQVSHPFRLKLAAANDGDDNNELFFQLQDHYFDDEEDGQGSSQQHQILVTASTASELSAGVGWYLREQCNMTIGWPRGGGSRIVIPKNGSWPKIGNDRKSSSSPVILKKVRQVPWSYLMVSVLRYFVFIFYFYCLWFLGNLSLPQQINNDALLDSFLLTECLYSQLLVGVVQ